MYICIYVFINGFRAVGKRAVATIHMNARIGEVDLPPFVSYLPSFATICL